LSKIRLILPIYNKPELIEGFLNSFIKYQPGVDSSLFIIDNGNDNSANIINEIMNSQLPKYDYEIYKPGENLGFPKSINLALDRFENDIVILNNDIQFTQENWLKNIVEYSDKMNADICSCINITTGIKYYGGIIQDKNNIRWLRFDRDNVDPTWVFFTCCYVKNKVFERIPKLDEDFGMGYFEDVAFQVFAKEKGFNIAYCPDVEIHHYSSSSFQTEEKNKLIQKNKEIFFKKYEEYIRG